MLLHSLCLADSMLTATKSYVVHSSPVHGNGVFAERPIEAGEMIVEYEGERVPWDVAQERHEEQGLPVNYTLFFTLEDGNVIDGGSNGNEARFINHSCEPNCEAYEENGRVFIHALHDIEPGEELCYNYALIYEGRHTAAIKKAFECRCGAPSCSGVMLAPKKKKKAKKA
jgi:SET domain-containing protein